MPVRDRAQRQISQAGVLQLRVDFAGVESGQQRVEKVTLKNIGFGPRVLRD